ncbi:MAG: hypothetical protein IPM61_00770 [Chlorobi bacterium]|nr:MAG: hypothetical protein UZ07_CHB004001220 [Chlorobi bacterium OLB7]MBK8909840.1 hypothetical protein [Chlorobiota bacterium]MBX7215593.1 hypothetical protein [Candidatus Kapabacteria bacterium]
MKFLLSCALLFLVGLAVATAQTKTFSPLVPRDKLEYIVVLESGDRFRGNVVASGDTFQIKTEFDIVRVPKNLIKEFIPITFPRDTYLHRSQHFLMPTASPAGPGFSLTNYELGFLYATFGLGYGATINAGATIVPTVSLKSQLYHVNAKFTVEREKDMEFAVGGTYTFFTTDHPYAHIYGVGTFALGTGRYSAMIFYKAAGDEQAPVNILGPGEDTTQFTLYYQGAMGAAFGFDAPAFGRDDMFWVGEIATNDFSRPENTVSMVGIRLQNEHLSADFGIALSAAPLVLPVTSFRYRF